MTEEKALGLLGLAHRAGAIASGAMQVEKALLSGHCKLLLIAVDTAAETKKQLAAISLRTGVPSLNALTKLQMGTAVGKSPKAALAVTDTGFAGAIRRMLCKDDG
jgi:ribosomal protein L7Ae-like RNA K-turn-binding protein